MAGVVAMTVVLWLRAASGAETTLVAAFWVLLAAGLSVAVVRPARFAARRLPVAVAAA